MPEPARGISRWRLDAGMAEKFTAAGGALHCGQRVTPPAGAEGWVLATGRLRAEESPWFAQKEHFQNLPLSAGLEMHMGRGGYAGIARVEDGLANLCALLPAAVGKSAATLTDRLRACGLTALAARLEAAQPVEASRCGVASFRTGWQPHEAPLLSIGDHCALIPPFTGHGMSMAILAALDAEPPLAAWSRGHLAWPDTVTAVRTALHRRFHSRLRWAAWLHPLLLRPAGQSTLRLLARCGLLPWHWLYHKVR